MDRHFQLLFFRLHVLSLSFINTRRHQDVTMEKRRSEYLTLLSKERVVERTLYHQ
jgi:hypothetical protein